MFSSCDALPYHWNPTSMAERVGLPPCNGSPTLNIFTHRFSVPRISPVSKSCGDGGVAKRQVEMRLMDHPSRGRFTKNQQKKLLVGAWNVRTLLDRDNTARPERRTALIAKELARYRIDIAALSERIIIQSIWDQEKMPDDFRDALIVALYKNKGSKADCGNYRGISLLSIAGKIFARIILNRLIAISEANLPEAQCGFRPCRSTVDMIFTVRRVQENLTKAFDTVSREALWDVLARYGCPPKFIQIIRLFHVDMTGQVLSNGEQSDPFSISNGVKQGCALGPVLFNLFFACVLRQAVGNTDKGVYVRFRYDGSIFDLRRLSAKTKTLNSLIQEALFADDCALMAHKPGDLQAMLNSFSDASKQFGLSISLEKTEVLFQLAPNSVTPQPAVFIDDVELKVVDSFKYLGSMVSVDGSLDKEIAYRISKASQALGRLRNRLLNHHNVTLDTKLKVYRAVVLSSLLYGCETWTVYRRHLKQLERFHQRALRSILGIRWQDRATNTKVFKRQAM